MLKRECAIPASLAGQPMQAALRRLLPELPERELRDAFARRDVKMDATRVGRDAPAAAGAAVALYLPDRCAEYAPHILYEDASLLVVDKPTGLSCEADALGGPTVGEWLQNAYPGRFATQPMPCHRLDNPTDGLLLMALTPQALAAMEQAFRDRLVHKRYTCLVKGMPTPAHAVLDAYLLKDAAHALVRIADRPLPGALTIRTEYQVLEAGEVSRLNVTLHTGRTHQIRAHLSHIGHPLLGDDKYGERDFNRTHHAKRLMLTATELAFSLAGEYAYLNSLRFTLPTRF